MSYTTKLQIAYYDPAERMYVEEGLSPQAIADIFANQHGDDAPSRRTIYNWSQDGDWGAKRRRWVQETEDIDASMREAIRVAAKEAIANPNRDSFSALRNAVSSKKMWAQLQGIERAQEEGGGDPDASAEDALAIVRKVLEGK